ncbi:hypothetical protein WME79_33470 [Sorangium sp. So ce726]|uniref:hypothetical protein n=1 Tax=Sorangium sp. So ce726 TaxID=3133319 RepID=UPI003F609C0B
MLPPMRTIWPGAVLSGLLSLVIAAPASAQPDAVAVAESLFNRGLADMLAGKFQTGCPALTESYRLDPRPGRLFTLAECEAKWGRTATAVSRYNDFLALYSRMSESEQLKQYDRYKIVLEQRDALVPLVPQLTLSLPADAPAGTLVQRDGITLEGPSLGIALPVNPGEHVVTTRAPGGPVHEMQFTIEKSEQKTIELEVKLPDTPPPATPTDQPPHQSALPPSQHDEGASRAQAPTGTSGRRVLAYVTGGLALGGLIAGGVTGVLALDESRRADEDCDDVGSGRAVCNTAEGQAAGKRAKDLGLVSTIGFGAGAALAGTALVLFLTEPSSSGSQASATTGAQANAAHRHQAGAVTWSLLAGPTGGGVVVRSQW